MSYRFIGNIYNPDGPDAVTKLLSENYGDRSSRRKVGLNEQVDVDGFVLAGKISLPLSPEKVVRYVKNTFLKHKILGKPQAPKNSSLTDEQLSEMDYVGIYEPIQPPNRRSAPSTGTGTGESLYPHIARYGKNGKILEVIDPDHKVI